MINITQASARIILLLKFFYPLPFFHHVSIASRRRVIQKEEKTRPTLFTPGFRVPKPRDVMTNKWLSRSVFFSRKTPTLIDCLLLSSLACADNASECVYDGDQVFSKHFGCWFIILKVSASYDKGLYCLINERNELQSPVGYLYELGFYFERQ